MLLTAMLSFLTNVLKMRWIHNLGLQPAIVFTVAFPTIIFMMNQSMCGKIVTGESGKNE